MGTLGGIALIVGITLIAGVIAYIGDRVGHQVGRRRLTLFNLRPKYTSTIVAVGTGMMIALAVTAVVLLSSAYARAAFFHLQDLNNQVNQLQAQADYANRQLRESNIVINRGDLLYDQFLVIEPHMSAGEKLKAVSAFFDAVVQSLDRLYVPRGLKPYSFKSNDAEVKKKLQNNLLDDERVQGFLLQGPVIVLAIADQNLFVNDPIHFGFQPYLDHLIFRAHQPIARLEVDGGSQFVPRIAFTQLSGAVQDAAIGLGMPGPFARALTTLNEQQLAATSHAIRSGHGRFYLVVQAAIDIYPHTGGIPVEFTMSRTPK